MRAATRSTVTRGGGVYCVAPERACVGCHQHFQFARVREAVDLGVLAFADLFGEFPQPFCIGAPGASGGGGEEGGAFQFFALQVSECRLQI